MSEEQQQPLISHLIELRNRLLKAVFAILIIFLGLFYFANDLYLILVRPLSVLLPDTGQMIATGVIAPFLVPFKLTFVLAVLFTVPYLLHQVWAFISPEIGRAHV